MNGNWRYGDGVFSGSELNVRNDFSRYGNPCNQVYSAK